MGRHIPSSPGNFPGGPVVKTLFPQSEGHRLNESLVGELRSCMLCGSAKKKKKRSPELIS